MKPHDSGGSLYEEYDRGAGSLKSELESLNCFKISLLHAESIYTVLGENGQWHPYWSARFQISGLEGRGLRLESDVEIWEACNYTANKSQHCRKTRRVSAAPAN